MAGVRVIATCPACGMNRSLASFDRGPHPINVRTLESGGVPGRKGLTNAYTPVTDATTLKLAFDSIADAIERAREAIQRYTVR